MAVKRTKITVKIETEEYADTVTLSPKSVTTVLDYAVVLEEGTGQGQANVQKFHDDTFVASTPQDLDVATLTDSFGVAKTMAKMKVLAVQTMNTVSGQQWQIGGDAASIPVFGAAADYLKLGPNGLLLWVDPIDGIAVTATTGDIMQVAPPSVAARAKTLIVGNT